MSQVDTGTKSGKIKYVENKKKYYNAIEKSIFQTIKETRGSKQLFSTTRIKHDNKTKEGTSLGGDTEWFYTNPQTLNNAFDNAYKIYGGRNLHPTDLNDINSIADRNAKLNNVYKAEIYYKIPTK